MPDHQPMPVHGYTVQSETRIRLVNHNKILEESILQHFDDMKQDPGIDQRWLAIGRTHIEEAFMAANRSVFKPERFKLPAQADAEHGLQPFSVQTPNIKE